MNIFKKSIIPGVVCAWALLSLGAAGVLADEKPGEEPAEKPAEQPAAPTAMTTPGMSAPLTANPNPMSMDAGFPDRSMSRVRSAVSGCGRIINFQISSILWLA